MLSHTEQLSFNLNVNSVNSHSKEEARMPALPVFILLRERDGYAFSEGAVSRSEARDSPFQRALGFHSDLCGPLT